MQCHLIRLHSEGVSTSTVQADTDTLQIILPLFYSSSNLFVQQTVVYSVPLITVASPRCSEVELSV